jgi:hypothetical protein
MATEEHISLYTNILTDTPNNGYYSGVRVSREHSLLFPVLMYANSNTGPTVQKLSVRCDAGYKTATKTIISIHRYDSSTGKYLFNYDPENYLNYLYLSKNNNFTSDADALANGVWNKEIEIDDTIEDRNILFWVKCIPMAKKNKYQVLTNLALFLQTYTIKI